MQIKTVKHFLMTCSLLFVSVFARGQCSISIQSSGTLICGNSVGIYATFSGSNFQWYKNGNLIPGATSSSMTLSSGQGGSYYLTAKVNGCPNVSMSNTINITDNSPSGVSVSPSGNTTICKGYSVQLNATYVPSYTYQWAKNGAIINGATSNIYSASETGDYKCIVTNGSCTNEIGSSIPVTVIDPVISPAAFPILCSQGQTVTFSTEANPLYNAYQWRKDGVIINGATSPSYTASSTGSYTVTVTYNSCQSTSNPRFINPLPTPTVSAGPDKTAAVSNNSFVINGTGSHTSCPVTYSWTKIIGPGVTMNGTNTSALALTNLVGGGNYVFRLTCSVNGVSASDDMSLSVDLTPLQKDSLVLLDLYTSLTGSKWLRKANWLTGRVSTWEGVKVFGDRVKQLQFGNNQMSGKIPASIGNLTALTVFEFGGEIIPEIPAELGNCKELIVLSLTTLGLKNLPLSLSSLKKLQSLDIQRNNFNVIPACVFNMTALTHLDISRSNLVGRMPEDFGRLINLQELRLNNNLLSGDHPACFATMNTSIFYLSNNNLKAASTIKKSNGVVLDIINNKLDFGDLEYLYAGVTPYLNANPQDTIHLMFDRFTSTFSVLCNGTNNKYQWQKNGANLSGATNSTLVLTPAEVKANDAYKCIITNTRITNLTLFTDIKRPKDQFHSQGDYITKASGNWNDYKIWKWFDGQQIVEAFPGELPDVNNSVFVEKRHALKLAKDQNCKNLNLNVQPDSIRLNTRENILNVYGKLRLYSGSAPGVNDSTSAGIPGWINTGTNGRIRLKGNANRVITEKNEFSDHINMKGWKLECDFDQDSVTGIVNSNFRADNVIITTGNLNVKSQSFKLNK